MFIFTLSIPGEEHLIIQTSAYQYIKQRKTFSGIRTNKNFDMSTTYFKIDSTDEGGYPQVECDCVPIMQLISPWKLHNENFCSLEFTLNKKAMLTDLLSKIAGSNTDLLISDRFKNAIHDCNIMRHQYFNVIVNTKKGQQTYYLLHLCQPDLVHFIDYRNTNFYEKNGHFTKVPYQ